MRKTTNFASCITRRSTYMHCRSCTTSAPLTHQAVDCWNCKKKIMHLQKMICSDCGHLQDVNTSINYFDLLSFPIKFELEPLQLTKRFRQLQTLVHPDKFSNKSDREQSNSSDWSSLINKAYKTLATPVDRGQYLLNLKGEQMPQDNSSLNAEFLMNMMERNEEVEEAADNAVLEQLNNQIIIDLEKNANTLSKHFEAKEFENIKKILVEMKYLLSIQQSIKKKQQSLITTIS
ncbi:uncharacterized protein Dwil_GK16550 [Drosophila willistoni]|uniref:J domain-containing protein n=1 Tax=Drosophila willistoni TaxID=7260 RepID=B4MN80_DROWI|nr:iron-sulfur cluster co-chaperone protein HscB [Drosophila willistoni]EDW73636.2 uncharacterized protein Dwil_GK16550 [Drosophila willistoni]